MPCGSYAAARWRPLALRSIGSLSGIQFLGIFEWKTFEKTVVKLSGIFKHILDGLLGGIGICLGWLNISSTFVNLQVGCQIISILKVQVGKFSKN